ADPERAAQRRRGRDVGERAPRRRRRHRQLDPRGHGRGRRRDGRRGRAARAGAHDRSGHGRHAARRRGVPGGRGSGPSARPRRADVGLRDGMSSAGGGRRLLIRDLAQLATPRGTEAPLRGHALGDVEVLEDAYVLCVDANVEAIGRMQDLRSVAGEVEELDARGLCAVPGLVDCHAHACFAGDRVEEFAMRAGGATYEELHAAGGGIMATVNATRAAGESGLAEAVRTHRAWMLRTGTTTFESKSGYGLDRETELASLRAIAAAGAAVALATDFNPGSAFSESLPLVCSLAATQLGLSPAEALSACTVNAADVLGRSDRLGRLAPGYAADIVLLDAPDWR